MHPRITVKGLAAGVGVGALCASSVLFGVGQAGAAPARGVTHTVKSAVVVKVSKSRHGFKNVLTNTRGVGATLYTAKSCTGSCLTIWPPLYMPSGATVPKGPKGVTGLGTVKVGKHLQVTYKGHRLYTFSSDSGTSVNGNGVAGFTVIKNA